MIPDNQLARRIQSTEPVVGSVEVEAPYEAGGLGGRSPPNINFIFAMILMSIFLHTFQMILGKKKIRDFFSTNRNSELS